MSGRAARGRPPGLLIPPAIIGLAFLLLPTAGLLIRAPWHGLARIYSHTDVTDALRISVETSLQAVLVSLVLGVPLAWMLARVHVRGMALVRAVVTMPLVLPPVVGGVGLLLALGRNGYVGRYLNSWFGWQLPFTSHAVVLAQTFVAMPFLVVTVEGALRTADAGLEEAAATLGATPWRVFSRVTLPLIGPSLVAGSVLCWARALGEFGATVIFAGNTPGLTQTMPTAVLQAFDNQPQDAVALSLVLLLIALVVLTALRDSWLRPAASA